jgi:hypothetical protein
MSDTIRSPAGLLVGAFKNLFAPGAAKSATVSSQFRLTPGMMLNGVQLNNVTAMQYGLASMCWLKHLPVVNAICIRRCLTAAGAGLLKIRCMMC